VFTEVTLAPVAVGTGDTRRAVSTANREIVRRAYEAWNRGDLDSFLSLVHPDAEWTAGGTPDLFLGIEPLYRGQTGVRTWWEFAKEPWEYFRSHVESTMEEGDTVITEVRFEAVGKESGVKVEYPLVNVIDVRDGLMVRFASYYTLEDALESEGLQKQ
jgi:ketosteroid isomerase-like protein